MRAPARHRGRLGALALLATASQGAQAQPARPDTRALTCAQASALVARDGAVVMTTGPFTYQRIVRDGGFCTIETTTRPDYEATRDELTCFVGYRCVERLDEGRNGP